MYVAVLSQSQCIAKRVTSLLYYASHLEYDYCAMRPKIAKYSILIIIFNEKKSVHYMGGNVIYEVNTIFISLL